MDSPHPSHSSEPILRVIRRAHSTVTCMSHSSESPVRVTIRVTHPLLASEPHSDHPTPFSESPVSPASPRPRREAGRPAARPPSSSAKRRPPFSTGPTKNTIHNHVICTSNTQYIELCNMHKQTHNRLATRTSSSSAKRRGLPPAPVRQNTQYMMM